MAENIAIGVGGTGTKIIEALIYISLFGGFDMACKIGNEAYTQNKRDKVDRLIVKIVDPDGNNGMLKRLNDLLDCFRDDGGSCKDLNVLFTDFACPKIDAAQRESVRWGNEHRNTIEDTFSGTDFDNIRTLLYSKYDRETVQLSQGSWGKPRIGTLALTYAFHKDYENFNDPRVEKASCFWPNLVPGNNFNDGVKIMFAGSIFGGTGASVIRNLSGAYVEKLCNTYRAKCGIGMLFVLPYFKYNDNALEGGHGAKSTSFPVNTKLALSYYSDSIFTRMEGVSPVLYLSGGDSDSDMFIPDGKGGGMPAEVSKDGEDQANPAMPSDLYSALSMLHFFTTPSNDEHHRNSVYIPAENDESVPYLGVCKIILNRLRLFCELWNEAKERFAKKTITDAPFTDLQINVDTATEKWGMHLSKVDRFVESANTWLEHQKLNNLLDGFLNNGITDQEKSEGLIAWRKAVGERKNYKIENEIYPALARTLMSVCEKLVPEVNVK